MPWRAQLDLQYRTDGHKTTLSYSHQGPLRILKSLYPEGDGICHNVIVHPPGGVVGGDELAVNVQVDAGAHALIGTPGATRFYRSDGPQASQRVHLRVAAGARLEWLPLETIAYPGCQALNRIDLALEDGAECLGWDVLALGLPGAGQPFDEGRFGQHVEWPGVWLERAQIDAHDTRLLDGPVGLAGRRCLGTLWLASGRAREPGDREALLVTVREALADLPADCIAGATSPDARLIVVRALGPVVEPVMAGLQRAWAALRTQAWGIAATAPRIWRV